MQGRLEPEQLKAFQAGVQAQEAHLIAKRFEDAGSLPNRTTTALQPVPGSSFVTSTASQEYWQARDRFLDALELETIVWLPEGKLAQLLDPSADRWRGDE